MLKAFFLGQYEIYLDEKPVIISSHLDQLLLAYLMLNVNRNISREQVAGILWPDSLDAAARKNLRNSAPTRRVRVRVNHLGTGVRPGCAPDERGSAARLSR